MGKLLDNTEVTDSPSLFTIAQLVELNTELISALTN